MHTAINKDWITQGEAHSSQTEVAATADLGWLGYLLVLSSAVLSGWGLWLLMTWIAANVFWI